MDQLTHDDPSHIGPYRLLARLGAGGMGEVYLARSAGGRTVAVKLVRSELATEPEFRRRFAQEIAAARRVGGLWTAAVLDADTDAPAPWVATAYVPGPSLHAVLAGRTEPLPERSVRILAHRLAQALTAVHTAGLIHRDLKPANVLVTIDGPRVIDFGIARALDAVTADGKLTRTGAVIGSPGYMSPEQVRGEALTPVSDVFSLGSVLAFAGTRRHPFGSSESGMHAVMYRIAQEQPDLTGLPAGLTELVGACLAKDPADRPAPEEVVARTQEVAQDTEPWLPGALIAELGRKAAELLDSEGPGQRVPARPAGPPPGATPPPPATAPHPTGITPPLPAPADPAALRATSAGTSGAAGTGRGCDSHPAHRAAPGPSRRHPAVRTRATGRFRRSPGRPRGPGAAGGHPTRRPPASRRPAAAHRADRRRGGRRRRPDRGRDHLRDHERQFRRQGRQGVRGLTGPVGAGRGVVRGAGRGRRLVPGAVLGPVRRRRGRDRQGVPGHLGGRGQGQRATAVLLPPHHHHPGRGGRRCRHDVQLVRRRAVQRRRQAGLLRQPDGAGVQGAQQHPRGSLLRRRPADGPRRGRRHAHLDGRRR
ncbi:hypothetical protein F750_3373 [Streptomyces sp. PAMC 26508]|nr:hypothetical protein F750_3373 [Streptomyces sp. PAMC 26508]